MSPPSGAECVEYVQVWRVRWFVRVVVSLRLPAIASGGSGVRFIWGVAILLGLHISSIVALLRILFVVCTPTCPFVEVLSSIVTPGSMESSGSMLSVFLPSGVS